MEMHFFVVSKEGCSHIKGMNPQLVNKQLLPHEVLLSWRSFISYLFWFTRLCEETDEDNEHESNDELDNGKMEVVDICDDLPCVIRVTTATCRTRIDPAQHQSSQTYYYADDNVPEGGL